MGAYVFNNEIFDSWLNKKSDEILSKVDRERISTEEMIILVLKAQTNHFYHMDIDMKKGMSDFNYRFEGIEQKFAVIDQKFDQVERKIEKVEQKIEKVEQKIEKVEQKFDQRFYELDKKIDNRFMWMIGITLATTGGLYLKLFLG